MSFRLVVASSLLALAGACVHPGPSATRLEADVAWLSAPEREGRGLGTQGLEAAARYIAGRFAEAGLRPGGSDGGFLQPFETVVAIRNAGARLRVGALQLEGDAAVAPLMVSESGHFAGPLAFAGYGISAPDRGHDDYQDLDVDGRVVVVLEGRPEAGALEGPEGVAFLRRRAKIMAARRRGAAGVLFVPETRERELGAIPHAADPNVQPAGLFGLRLSRPAAAELLHLAGRDLESLAARASSGEPVSLTLDLEASGEVRIERTRGPVANVVGVLPGRDPSLSDEAIVIGAHYDHLGRGGFGSLAPSRQGEVHPGADDNASGTAALLEIARRLAAGPPLRRTLTFVAFTAEEVGLLGSAHFVDRRPEGLPAPVAMLNMDMVGRLREGRIVVFGSESADEWRPLLDASATALGLDLALEGHGTGPSDQTSFYVKSVPVLHFFTGVHSAYHTPDDVASAVDARGLARVCDLVARVAGAAANAEEAFAFRGQPAKAHAGPGGGPGYGPDLGTIPAFGGEPVVGVRLAGVRPGSPAERAGLRGGDVLVSFAGVTVRDLAEFAALLFAERAGREVDLVVLRGQQRIETKAILGARR